LAVQRLELLHIDVPLKRPIRHASHERTGSDNLVVRLTLDDGTVGHGEGVPRPYVTGETIESTFAALSSLDLPRLLGRPADFPAAVEVVAGLRIPETESDPRGMAGNAARCALELALLDAFGRKFGRPLGDAVPQLAPAAHLRPAPGAVRYSGAITAESRRKERISAIKMRIYGFSQVKVKVGVAGQDDAARLRALRRILGSRMDIRIDANEAWPADGLVERVRPLLPSRPSALEQPVPHAEVGRLAELRPRLGIPVMLDESLCGLPDAERAIRDDLADILNVRLSKCGGVVPSLRIMALASRAGKGVQLGCHPGETAILSAAGRHVAANLRGIRYLEGSYDRHVLLGNVIRGDITFGYGGRAAPLAGPGLGIEVDPAALEALTVRRQQVTYG
jgi:muconate cycloisomerase